MEGILHTFGIDARLIGIQVFNFVLLAVLLSYFLYKPVMNMLRDREAKIKQGVEDAENAKVRLDEADSEKAAIVTAAHKEAGDIAERARVHADEKSAEIMHAAEDKAAHKIKEAEAKSEEMKVQALKESEAEIAKLAVLAAEKVLREEKA